jgi:hypothetical protein
MDRLSALKGNKYQSLSIEDVDLQKESGVKELAGVRTEILALFSSTVDRSVLGSLAKSPAHTLEFRNCGGTGLGATGLARLRASRSLKKLILSYRGSVLGGFSPSGLAELRRQLPGVLVEYSD